MKSANNYEPCILCGDTARDLIYEKSFGNIVKCVKCSLISAAEKDTGKYVQCEYNKDYYKGSRCGGYKDYFGEEREVRSQVHRDFANITYSLIGTKGNVLDIGCAGGQFLSWMQNLGMGAEGIELSEYAAEKARQDFSLAVFSGDVVKFASMYNRKFELITLFDVIEHLINPVLDLRVAHSLLSSFGKIFLSTPLYGGKASQSQGKNFFQFKKDHRFYFTKDTLGKLLTSSGYEEIQLLTFEELLKESKCKVSSYTYEKYSEKREQIFALAS